MSKYTTEVRFICEMESGRAESGGFGDIDEIISASHNKIIGDYPIFDETYREVLNSKILRHYYTREICEETVGLWKLRLNSRMNEIMPYYNKLYKSELLNFNPLYDVDVTTTRKLEKELDENKESDNALSKSESGIRKETEVGKNSGVSTEKVVTGRSGTSVDNRTDTGSVTANRTTEHSRMENNENHSSGSGRVENDGEKEQLDKYSDTPQGALDGVQSGEFLTNARIIGGTEKNVQVSGQSADGTGRSESKEKGNEGGIEKSTMASKGSVSESESGNEDRNESVEGNSNRDLNVSNNLVTDEKGKKVEKGTVTSTDEYLESVQGKHGSISYSKMLMEYRETFLNIDMKIIEELGDLFFGLW